MQSVYTDMRKEGAKPMAQTEAQKRAKELYDKRTAKKILLKLNINTDADILEILEKSGNKQGYIKALIRADKGKSIAKGANVENENNG